MKVYVALNSVPDYHAPAPSFKSVHATLEGAALALYPDRGIKEFRQTVYGRKQNEWDGPDGFGLIAEVEILP